MLHIKSLMKIFKKDIPIFQEHVYDFFKKELYRKQIEKKKSKLILVNLEECLNVALAML